ncbi:MAG: glycosyltransferase [Prevotella sp.]|nr:glycosyltransferase [Prevotella sp.]
MLTLLQINITANCGSHGKIAEEIGQLAISYGWQSHIAYGRKAQPSHSHLIRIGSMWDEYIHGIQSRIMDNHGLASSRATKHLIKTIQFIKPDIIHLHNIHGYYLNYPLIFQYLAEANIPVVWTLHDCWPITGHCAHFDSIGCDRWKIGCHHCPNKSSYPASLIFDNSKNNYTQKKYYFNLPSQITIVTVSKWQEEIVKDSFLRNHPTVTINNGINLDIFKPKKKLISDNKFHILGVASTWNKDKGIDEFVQLSKIMYYDITLVGVPEHVRNKLPRQINCIEHTSNVQELVSYYSNADVFVNPTYNDTYPTVNLEAQACGTPVVTYATGGSPETINSKTGIVVERGNINALVEAIESIRAKSPTERESISMLCAQRAQLLFDQKLCFSKYIELYQKLLNKKL